MQADEKLTGHVPHDIDVDFEMHESSTTATSSRREDQDALKEKQEKLARNDFKPLTEEEKQPKLQDEDFVKDLEKKGV